MADITYSGVSLGQMQTIKENNNCGLVDFPLPGTGAGGNIIYDLGGVSRDFELTTKYVSTSAGVSGLLATLDNWTNGRQGGSPVPTLALPFSRSKPVIIKRWDWNTDANRGGETDTGSNIVVDLRIDFAYGDILNIWD